MAASLVLFLLLLTFLIFLLCVCLLFVHFLLYLAQLLLSKITSILRRVVSTIAVLQIFAVILAIASTMVLRIRFRFASVVPVFVTVTTATATMFTSTILVKKKATSLMGFIRRQGTRMITAITWLSIWRLVCRGRITLARRAYWAVVRTRTPSSFATKGRDWRSITITFCTLGARRKRRLRGRLGCWLRGRLRCRLWRANTLCASWTVVRAWRPSFAAKGRHWRCIAITFSTFWARRKRWLGRRCVRWSRRRLGRRCVRRSRRRRGCWVGGGFRRRLRCTHA